MYLVRTLLILLLFPIIMGGQTVFNNAFSVGGNLLTELLITDTTYITAAINNQDNKKLDFSIFDLQGNLIDTINYRFDSVQNFPGNCGKCFQNRHNEIYYAQYNSMASDTGYVAILKLRSDLSIKKVRSYTFRDSLTTVFKAMQFDTDSTFIATGYIFRRKPPLLGKYDLLVAKFDTAFNLLWEKRIVDHRPNQALGYIGHDISVDAYGSVLISGYGRYGPNTAIAARFRRSDGYMYWFNEYSDSLGNAGMFGIDNGDGTYQFHRHVATQNTVTMGTRFNKVVTGTLDTAGNMINLSSLGKDNRLYAGYDLIRTSDGNYYLGGYTYINGNNVGLGFKFAPNGDSLWMRYYWHDDQQDLSEIEIFFETQDSGFIHAGYYGDLFQPTVFTVQTWLLKTDKFGCDSIGCHTIGVPEVMIPGLLEVFPNPSQGRFRLSWTYGNPESFHLTIQDLNGKVLYRDEEAFLSEEAYAIDLTGQPQGLYLLNLSIDGKHVCSRKLVVE